MDDQPDTAARLAVRHAQLDRYRLAYREVYGREPSDELEVNDPILRELRGENPPPAQGHRVVCDGPFPLTGMTGTLLSTADGFAQVKADEGAIYRIPTNLVRVTS